MIEKDPIKRFQKTIKRAEKSGAPLPNAMSLATVGANKKPSARMMLLKSADHCGFTFYTNTGSRKVEDLRANSKAAICFWWPILDEQVRIEGRIRPVSDSEADTYFATRPRGSQLGAWASRQSKRLTSRNLLVKNLKALQKKYKGEKVPRPPFWSGFLLVPDYIEFWHNMPDRLHERTCYTCQGRNWKIELLYP